MKETLSFTHRLHMGDVDLTGQLSVPGLAELFQELAADHSRELGADHDRLLENSRAYWVVARIRMRLFGGAGFGDPVTATTWPLRPDRVRFDREMTVTTEDGRQIAAVSSEWCVLDADTHRIRRADSVCFPMDLPFREERAGAGERARLPRSTDGMEACFSHTVRYTDLDMNRHTNNAVYTKLAMDSFSAAELEERPVTQFEIAFLKESFEGDTLTLWRRQAENGVYMIGINDQNGETVFSAFAGASAADGEGGSI